MTINTGQDFWRWQVMNPHGYRTSIKNDINEHS